MLNTIRNVDCLIGMKDIADGSVDAIICDLPYEVLNKSNRNASWDNQIDLNELWKQYLRVTKPNAPIILFAQGLFTARLILSNEKMFRYTLVWQKGRPTGFLNAKKMPMRSHEDIVVFYQNLPTYNPQMRKGDSHSRGNGIHKTTNQCYGSFEEVKDTQRKESDLCYPTSVLHFDKEHDSDTWHPTQKPLDLIRYLIRTYTNEGDTVLDNCMGSGTTALACIMEKRNFIGFEMNEEYCRKANDRIKRHQSQLTLF